MKMLLHRAQSAFGSKHCTFQVDSRWTNETAVSATLAKVRLQLLTGLKVFLVKRLLNQNRTQVQTARPHTRTTTDTIRNLNSCKLLSLRKLRLNLPRSRLQFSHTVKIRRRQIHQHQTSPYLDRVGKLKP